MQIFAEQHGQLDPSPWVVRWAESILPQGRVLDLACGGGRHARFLADKGHPVLAVDLDCSRVSAHESIQTRQLDLEGPDWPLTGEQFDAVVVTHYLYRPHFDALLATVAPGGLLIYETFALGNERFGRPRNPDHLLRPGELLERTAPAFESLGFEEGEFQHPRPSVMQRICARRLAG